MNTKIFCKAVEEHKVKGKWILIDEYQDFSKLFHDLILSMIEGLDL